ncbi:MAG: restriction endonuclease subunit S [Acidimicrobiaceae bacterium]|nr:restriction endonuclease subunit S [Acidimicrobiaceae bacterium]
MIDARPDELEKVLKILQEHVPEHEVRAYGSRAKWTAWEYSDLDLVVVGDAELDFRKLIDLRSAFEESDLRFSVDVLDWHSIPDSFRQEIANEYVVIKDNVRSRQRPTVRLGDYIDINDSTFSSKDRWPQVSYLDTGNITENRISEVKSLSIGIDKIPARARRKVKPGDIVYSTVRPNQRHHGLLKEVPENMLVSTGFAVMRGKEGIADSGFVYYFLTQNHIVEHLQAIAENSTSTYPSIKPSDIEELEIHLPPIDEQRRIAGILGSLDDKIELNRRMSQTLEEMAQALFKSWFVDFDPVQAKSEGRGPALPARPVDIINGRFVESEVGLIPEDWRVGTLGEVAKETKSSVLPHSIASGTPYIGLAHMPKASIALSEWNWADHVESGKLAFRRGDILFGKLRPYFHKVGIAPIDGLCSTDIMVISPHSADTYGYLLGHVSSTMFVDYTNASSTGTRMPRTSWKVMSAYKVVIPPASVLKSFNDSICPMLDRIVANIHESFCLSNLRERLLPQLIDGKIPMASNERLPKGSKL